MSAIILAALQAFAGLPKLAEIIREVVFGMMEHYAQKKYDETIKAIEVAKDVSELAKGKGREAKIEALKAWRAAFK